MEEAPESWRTMAITVPRKRLEPRTDLAYKMGGAQVGRGLTVTCSFRHFAAAFWRLQNNCIRRETHC